MATRYEYEMTDAVSPGGIAAELRVRNGTDWKLVAAFGAEGWFICVWMREIGSDDTAQNGGAK